MRVRGPALKAVTQTNKAIRKNALLISGLAFALVVFVVMKTRVFLLFLPPLSSGLIVIGVMCLAAGFLLKPNKHIFEPIVATATICVLVIAWSYAYRTNTSLEANYKVLANYLCIALIFPALVCYQRVGVETTLKFLYLILEAYTLVYFVFALQVQISGSVDYFQKFSNPGAVVLFDPVRGYRLFFANNLVAFTIFYQSYSIAKRKNIQINLALVAIGLADLYMAKARGFSAAMISALIMMGLPRKVRHYSAIAVACIVFTILTIAIVNVSFLQDHLANDVTLSIRQRSIVDAISNFKEYPLLGLGLPGDNSDYFSMYSYYYDPTDLGVIGIAAACGISGAMWLFYIIVCLIRTHRVTDAVCASRLPVPIGASALSMCCILLVFTTLTSSSVVDGNGQLLVPFAIALLIYLKNLPQTTKAGIVETRSSFDGGRGALRRAASWSYRRPLQASVWLTPGETVQEVGPRRDLPV